MHRLEVPSPPVWLPAPIPPWPPAPWTRVKGLQVVPPSEVAPGGWRRRGAAGCVALTGRSFRSPPEAPEDYRWGQGCYLLGHGAQRRVSPLVPPPPPSGVITPGAPAAAIATAAGAVIASLPGSLESLGPQVSVVPFSLSLIIMPTSLNPSSVCQGFFLGCSQGHASSARYQAHRRVWLSAARIY
jgi:hypothetical protein